MANVKSFNVLSLHASLVATDAENSSVLIGPYLEAYEELVKFFPLLGSVFSFVVSDVEDKITILKTHRESDVKENYDNVGQMLVYEQQQGYTKLKKKSRHGARTLLRLHRALQFVIQFLTGLKENTGDNLSGVTWDAYKCTLGNYHPWIIKKTVGVAVYAVPTRQQLLEKMSSTHEEPEVDLMETLGKIIEAANVVYDNVEHLYSENNLLDLA